MGILALARSVDVLNKASPIFGCVDMNDDTVLLDFLTRVRLKRLSDPKGVNSYFENSTSRTLDCHVPSRAHREPRGGPVGDLP